MTKKGQLLILDPFLKSTVSYSQAIKKEETQEIQRRSQTRQFYGSGITCKLPKT